MKLSDLNRSDLVIRTAWLYYTYGLTQEEISRQLNLSRPMVQRMLAQATHEGLVKIRIDHPLVDCLELEKRLMERYPLRLCRVCPAPGEASEQVMPGLTLLGAATMEEFLRTPNPLTVALGTGRTLKACVHAISSLNGSQHRVVSLVGNLRQDGSASPFDSVMPLADKIGAERFFLPAPVIAANLKELKTLQQQPIYRNVVRIAEQADVSFISMAGLSKQSPLFLEEFITEAEMQQALDQGASGEFLGHILGQEGQLLEIDLNQRAAGVRFTPPLTRTVIGISGGTNKHHIIQKILQGGWMNGLITDEFTARFLIST